MASLNTVHFGFGRLDVGQDGILRGGSVPPPGRLAIGQQVDNLPHHVGKLKTEARVDAVQVRDAG